MDAVVIGLKGTVVAVDRATGSTLWSTHLKGHGFVTVAVESNAIFAATAGRLFRLDPSTGYVQWVNELPGLGFGLVSIAGASTSALQAEHKRQQDAHAAAS